MVKRRSDAEKASGPRPRKRMAFTAPKSATTKAKIKSNAETSPLLRLPAEIRRNIFREVLGDRLIHVKSLRYGDRWCLLVCDQDAAEPPPECALEGYKYSSYGTSEGSSPTPRRSSDPTEHVWKGVKRLEHYLIGHQEERQSDGSWELAKETLIPFDEWDTECTARTDSQKYKREMHLGLLRTCRLVYTEANQVLWETNIFSFNDVPSFTRFMGSASGFQKRSIKKLRLAMDWIIGVSPWNSMLNMTLVRSFQGLRELWLCINHSFHHEDYRGLEIDGPLWDFTQGPRLTGIRKLATLPLKRVNVRVVDRFDGLPDLLAPTWTEEDRQDYAKRLRNRLLNPNGADIYAKELEEELRK